jgi:hypothetical protein
MKVVRLSALVRAAFTPRKYSWNSFLLEVESSGRKDYNNKNFSDSFGNRTRDFPACSAVHQPTASLLYFQVAQHVNVNKTCIIHQSLHQAAPNVYKNGNYSSDAIGYRTRDLPVL